MCFNIIDKRYSIFGNNNYVSDCESSSRWCKRCVYYGTMKHNSYWLCASKYPEISEVSYCGHCDKFSDSKKINPIKRWLLTLEGFEFKNKAR